MAGDQPGVPGSTYCETQGIGSNNARSANSQRPNSISSWTLLTWYFLAILEVQTPSPPSSLPSSLCSPRTSRCPPSSFTDTSSLDRPAGRGRDETEDGGRGREERVLLLVAYQAVTGMDP